MGRAAMPAAVEPVAATTRASATRTPSRRERRPRRQQRTNDVRTWKHLLRSARTSASARWHPEPAAQAAHYSCRPICKADTAKARRFREVGRRTARRRTHLCPIDTCELDATRAGRRQIRRSKARRFWRCGRKEPCAHGHRHRPAVLDAAVARRCSTPRHVHSPPRPRRRLFDDMLTSSRRREDGYRVEEVADGGACSAFAGDRPRGGGTAQVDLVVSDIRMPIAWTSNPGANARRRVAVPVILMTAFGDAKTRERANVLGAILFDKPFDVDDLRTAASRMVDALLQIRVVSAEATIAFVLDAHRCSRRTAVSRVRREVAVLQWIACAIMRSSVARSGRRSQRSGARTVDKRRCASSTERTACGIVHMRWVDDRVDEPRAPRRPPRWRRSARATR